MTSKLDGAAYHAIVLMAVFVFTLPLSLCAQYERTTIDTVVALVPGTKQTSGQSPSLFPRNIFGVPDSRADTSTPITDPRSVCSIGYGGTITVGFSDYVVVDGHGADFTIFENAFRYGNNRIYAEPGRVEVSSNGVDYKQFPYDSSTLVGCAGVTPVYGKADPFNPYESGGDAFDLSTIGVDSIRFIRITDITSVISENPQHRFYDPTLTGFDLDAICTWHAVRAPLESSITHIAGTTSVHVDVHRPQGTLRIYQVTGVLLDERIVAGGSFEVALDQYPPGALLVSLMYDGTSITRKVLR